MESPYDPLLKRELPFILWYSLVGERSELIEKPYSKMFIIQIFYRNRLREISSRERWGVSEKLKLIISTVR
jgi:hypothetical protein